ncbi:MAG TPA: hypothetical protein VJ757_08620 [Pseudonocardiaceae bacterium]|nr:hypothetical protein [Pseudonocardiaceae bacterium]
MKLLRAAITSVLVCLITATGGSPPATADAASAENLGALVPVPEGVTASFAVYDRQYREFTAVRHPHARFRAASVVKLLIALDYLLQHDPELNLDKATTDDQRMDILALRTMLRGSWDYAASVLWVRGGFTDVIDRMTGLIGLPDTSPPAPDQRGFWGYTLTSAADVVKIYNYVLDTAPTRYRDFIIGNLHASTRCAEDGRDQSFGIPRTFARPWGAKQGWSGWAATVPDAQRCFEDRAGIGEYAGPVPAMKENPDPPTDLISPLLHTTGTIGPGERNIVVIFTTYPKDTTWPQGAADITRLCGNLSLLVPGSRPNFSPD